MYNLTVEFESEHGTANLEVDEIPDSLKEILTREVEACSYRGSLSVEDDELVVKVRVYGTLNAKFVLMY